MTPTTRRIHEMSFQVVACDIPAELTVAEYRRVSAMAAATATASAPARRASGRRWFRRADRG